MIEKVNILKDVFGPYYKTKNEYLFFCPFCKHHKKKLSVNIDLNVYKCWVCDSKGKNIKTLVKRFADPSVYVKWQELDGVIDMAAPNIFEPIPPEAAQSIDLPEEYICLGNKNLSFSARKPLKYLQSRGLTRRDIIYHKIGYCETGEYRNRIIVPSFNIEGKCDYFIARTYTDDWYKYKNPNVSKNIIFNDLLIDWDSPITIVEGVFDTFKADNAVPLLGSTLNYKSRLFQKIVTHKPDIYMALDSDAREKSLNIANMLLKYDVKVWNIDTNSIEDVGAITKEIFADLKKESITINDQNILLHKIASI